MSKKPAAIETILFTAVAALVILLFARATLFAVFAIPSSSMAPTLRPGDEILVTRFLPGNGPARGDVVVFHAPTGADQFLVKRIIAVPGDHLEIRGGILRLNGRPLNEPYLADRARMADYPPEILPGGFYFAMGDNREHSIDSRSWGPLDQRLIVGRARLIFWSEGNGSDAMATAAARSDRSAPAADESRVHWSRVLRSIH